MKTWGRPAASTFTHSLGARRLVAMLVFMVFACCRSISTFGAPVTYAFGGHIIGGDGLVHLPSIGVGTRFSGTVAMDSSSPDQYLENTWQGDYRGGSLTFSIAGRTWESATYPVSLWVDDAGIGGMDSIGFSAGFMDAPGPPDLLDGSQLYQAVFILGDPSGTLLNNDGFPAEALAAGRFVESWGFVDFYDGEDCFLCTAHIVIDHFSLQPTSVAEPDAAALLICAVAMIGVATRRR